jgi:hypothetical protein
LGPFSGNFPWEATFYLRKGPWVGTHRMLVQVRMTRQ